MQDLALALVVLVAGCATDVAFVVWARAANRSDLWATVGASALIQVFGLVGLLIVVSEPTLLVANVAGHAVGSGLGVAISQKDKT